VRQRIQRHRFIAQPLSQAETLEGRQRALGVSIFFP